jgi:hypothetical protein
MEENQEKITRFKYWAVFLIIVGGIASFYLPEHAISSFFELLKDVITNLII